MMFILFLESVHIKFDFSSFAFLLLFNNQSNWVQSETLNHLHSLQEHPGVGNLESVNSLKWPRFSKLNSQTTSNKLQK